MHEDIQEVVRQAERRVGGELSEAQFMRCLVAERALSMREVAMLWHGYRARKARMACMTMQG